MRCSSMENKPTSLSIIPESKRGSARQHERIFALACAYPSSTSCFPRDDFRTNSGPVLLHRTTLKPNGVYSTGLLPYMKGGLAMRVMQTSNIFQ